MFTKKKKIKKQSFKFTKFYLEKSALCDITVVCRKNISQFMKILTRKYK